MKTTIILSLITFTFITGYKATAQTLGNACGSTSNPLTTDWEIPLNGFNFNFTENSATPSLVNIGFPLCTPTTPIARLNVLNDALQAAGYFLTRFNSSSSVVGVAGDASNSAGNAVGVHGEAIAPGGTYNAIGVNGQSTETTNVGLIHTGVNANAANGTWQSFAVNGDVYINGSAFATSDKNLKENITSFVGANPLLNTLNPVTFDYKQTGEYEKLHLPVEHQYGLIAQEVENVLPTFVKDIVSPTEYDTLGNVTKPSMTFKAVNYNGLIPILVQGHREQSAVIDSLQTANDELHAQMNKLNDRLTQLENCLSGVLPHLCQMSHNGIQQNTPQAQEFIRQQLAVYLSDKTAIVLDQNVPNPFAEQTVISFSVPETVKQAQILFYNGRGELIKTIDIRERGLGSLTVYGADLSSGTYMYTLVADGMIVATKKMVKQ